MRKVPAANTKHLTKEEKLVHFVGSEEDNDRDNHNDSSEVKEEELSHRGSIKSAI